MSFVTTFGNFRLVSSDVGTGVGFGAPGFAGIGFTAGFAGVAVGFAPGFAELGDAFGEAFGGSEGRESVSARGSEGWASAKFRPVEMPEIVASPFKMKKMAVLVENFLRRLIRVRMLLKTLWPMHVFDGQDHRGIVETTSAS